MMRFLQLFFLFVGVLGSQNAFTKDFTLNDYQKLRDSAQVLWRNYALQNNITSLETLSAARYDSIIQFITKQLEDPFPFVKSLSRQDDIILNGFLNKEKELEALSDSPEKFYQLELLGLEKKMFFSDKWQEYQNNKEKYIQSLKDSEN